MGSIFFGLDMATRALMAYQRAIEVTAHNLANANTPGYSRQVVNFTALPAYSLSAFNRAAQEGQTGSGVTISSIRRMRDAFFDYQIRSQGESTAAWRALRDVLAQVEVVVNEPSDHGLGALLGKFWTSWQELSAQPEDVAVRASLVGQAQSLASALQFHHQKLAALQRDVASEVQVRLGEVNDLARQIAAFNAEIAQTEVVGDEANDLRDQRDLLLDHLARLAKVTISEGQRQVDVLIDGRALVAGDRAGSLQGNIGAAGIEILWGGDGSAVEISGGTLGGLLEAAQSLLPQKMAAFQELGARLIAEVNALHATGYDLYGAAGQGFFSGSGASDIAVAEAIQSDVRRIAAASLPDASGDGSVALLIAQLRHRRVQLAAASELAAGASLPSSGLRVVRVTLGGGADANSYTLSSSAPGTLTLSALVRGTIAIQTIAVADMPANGFQTLRFSEFGIEITLGGNSTATAAEIVADLTSAAGDEIAVELRTPLDSSYRDLIAQMGGESQRAQQVLENQELLLQHLEQRRESVSGVSLDEEATELIRFQHGYRAAARIVVIMDEILDTLITTMGLVGR